MQKPATTRKIVVSPAKRTVQSGASLRRLGRSFMKSEKRVGPRTEPCGTVKVVYRSDSSNTEWLHN